MYIINLPTELETKELKLIDLVQSLGEYLNNEDGTLRAKSKHILTALNLHC